MPSAVPPQGDVARQFRDELDDAIMAAVAQGVTSGPPDYVPIDPREFVQHPPHMRKINAICDAAWAVVERWTEDIASASASASTEESRDA